MKKLGPDRPGFAVPFQPAHVVLMAYGLLNVVPKNKRELASAYISGMLAELYGFSADEAKAALIECRRNLLEMRAKISWNLSDNGDFNFDYDINPRNTENN